MRWFAETMSGIGWGLTLAWCVFCPTASGAQEAPAQGEPPVLFLHTEYLPYAGKKPGELPFRLGREIVRQAVLMAARDELGWTTRDETLQEAVPTQAGVVHLLVTERAHTKGKWNVKLIRHEGGEVLWEKTYDFLSDCGKTYGDIIPQLEADTHGELLAGLRSGGLAGAKPTRRNPSPPSPELEEQLGKVDIVTQFGAVRAAHAAIARQGETPEWLGVLARGYANLALLTDHLQDRTSGQRDRGPSQGQASHGS